MYPFLDRITWAMANRWLHLVAIAERHSERMTGMRGALLRSRIRAIRTWSRLRAILLVLLYLGLAGTAVAWLSSIAPGIGEAERVAQRLAAIGSALTGLITVLYFVTTRVLGQLEIGVLGLLLIQTPEAELGRNEGL